MYWNRLACLVWRLTGLYWYVVVEIWYPAMHALLANILTKSSSIRTCVWNDRATKVYKEPSSASSIFHQPIYNPSIPKGCRVTVDVVSFSLLKNTKQASMTTRSEKSSNINRMRDGPLPRNTLSEFMFPKPRLPTVMCKNLEQYSNVNLLGALAHRGRTYKVLSNARFTSFLRYPWVCVIHWKTNHQITCASPLLFSKIYHPGDRWGVLLAGLDDTSLRLLKYEVACNLAGYIDTHNSEI
jgi:hypothetical protein